MNFEADIEKCLETLRSGGTIVYPTDTIWGIGCDATNPEAVNKVFKIKKREESRALIVLLPEPRDLYQYVTQLDPAVFDYLASVDKITTVIYPGVTGLADNLIAADGTAGIRIVQDMFCKHLLKRFRKPIVSTSANISGSSSPAHFGEIDPSILQAVDYVVQFRQEERWPSVPSRVVRWEAGKPIILRP